MAHAYQPFLGVNMKGCSICGLSEKDGDHVPAIQQATAHLHPTAAMRVSIQHPAPISLAHPQDYVSPVVESIQTRVCQVPLCGQTILVSVTKSTETKTPPIDFNLHMHLHRQRSFSFHTFGPGARTAGILDHIRRELAEIEAKPTDLSEWMDVVILALDGAWRAGYTPSQIIQALIAKQERNESRRWPDWRTSSVDQAIEHIKNEE